MPLSHLITAKKSIRDDSADDTKNQWLSYIREDQLEINDLCVSKTDIVRHFLDGLAYYSSTAVKCHYPHAEPKTDPQAHGGGFGNRGYHREAW